MFGDRERALLEMARDRNQVFTFAEARAFGLSVDEIRGRVDAGQWLVLHRGVYVLVSAPRSLLAHLTAAVLAGGDSAFASARSAAMLHGLPGGRGDILEISCARWRRSRKGGLIVHERVRVTEADLRTVAGVRCSGPELTLIELAGVTDDSTAERAFHALRREKLATYDSIAAAFARHARRGVPGIARVRALLERYGPTSAPTESELETRVLQLIRRLGFDEPATQVVVRDAAGRFVGRADFGYPALRIAIQYHSRKWHATEADNERDDAQLLAYWRARWIPIVVRWPDVRSGGQAFAAALREAIAIRRREQPNMRPPTGTEPRK